MKTAEEASAEKYSAAGAYAVKGSVALSYVPAILFHLTQEPGLASMFAAVMQACLEQGYETGFRDGAFAENQKYQKKP